MNLQVSDIRFDASVQSRAELNQPVIDEYSDAMRSGAEFPPVVVFFDGEAHWLADGFHRIAAARQAGLTEFPADVRQGRRRDAILHAAEANASHGLRRTNADKRRAVSMLLSDDEWRGWSDSEIARRCGVSHTFASNLRSSLATVASETGDSTVRTYRTKHGTMAAMNTAQIGKTLKIDPEFSALLPPLQPYEYQGLEANLKADGCRDALVVWRQNGERILLDGHQRYEICRRHGIPFKTVEMDFPDRYAAMVWIIENQCRRKNLTPFERVELVLKLEDTYREAEN